MVEPMSRSASAAAATAEQHRPVSKATGRLAMKKAAVNSTTGDLAQRPKSRKAAAKRKPYLDRINVAPRDALHGTEYWKPLLIQPVIVPDLRHTGIRTQFDDPEDMDLLRPDGKSTRKLKSLIKTKVELVGRLEAEFAGMSSPRSGRADEYGPEGFVDELVPVPRVEDVARALSPSSGYRSSPTVKKSSPKKKMPKSKSKA
eukprot:CAMPEP_0171572096 /NCGR_PEP_ID=MMETSP0961-20121227/3901_1 /TAXON_ID=87120 /ORGANISM="Aurantiochytrium limacinum, Strain ATCCMYA-1381" /LENGTH=200 /DNA_ID=CAMNT_0012126841 /DNA_START=40 /DNA_END=638 /DNA_ORIENTATION=-